MCRSYMSEYVELNEKLQLCVCVFVFRTKDGNLQNNVTEICFLTLL